MPKLLQVVYDYWYPLTGNFNFDGRASTFIGSHGGYLDGDCYKWQPELHQSVTHLIFSPRFHLLVAFSPQNWR
eukprot:678885-Rhodomonas_salina.1